MLSEHRDMASAKRFFTQAKDVVGHKPERVTTDWHDAYPRAIRKILDWGAKWNTGRVVI
jgi:putative transposase